MSINIALIPLALAMRVVMGEKGFEDFVRKQEDVKYTKFKSLNEVEKIVKSAGYDFGEQWGILKTHFKTKDFFTWEIREGYICAVFSVYDETSDINTFIYAVEKATGARCFYGSVAEINTNSPHKAETQQPKMVQPLITEQIFQTKFTNKNLLIKALGSIGLKCVERNSEIICSSDNYTLIFTNRNNAYEFRIRGSVTNKEAYQKYKDIDTRYGKVVQQEVVQNVKSKLAKSSTMQLEREEILEDNSVLLTIRV